MLINVADYPRVDVALEAAKDGDRVYFPGTGTPYVVPSDIVDPRGWVIDKSLEIFGDGPGYPGSSKGTILMPTPGTDHHVLTIDSQAAGHEIVQTCIRDLAIVGSASGRDGGSAIRYNTAHGYKLGNLRLERLCISNMAGAILNQQTNERSGGIDLRGAYGTNEDSAINYVQLFDLDSSNCGGPGVAFQNAYGVEVRGSHFASNGAEGFLVTSNGQSTQDGVGFGGGVFSFHACRFESNAGTGQLAINIPGGARVDGCTFRQFGASPACLLSDIIGGVTVSGCRFESGGTGIKLNLVLNTRIGGVIILPNRFVSVTIAVDVSAAVPVDGLAVYPQYCDPLTTVMTLPADFGNGTVGSATQNGPSGYSIGGLIVPAYASDPTGVGGNLHSSAQVGMVVLVGRGGSPVLRTLQGVSNWKTITTI